MLLRILSFLFVFCLGATGGIWAQAFLLPFFASHLPFQNWQFVKDWSARVTVISPVQEIIITESDAVEKAIEKGRKVTIGIQSIRGTTKLEGSGVIVTSDGLIVTLSHIVPEGYEVTVLSGENEQAFGKAEVVKRDTKNDLALIKLDKENLATASFAKMEDIKLGISIVLAGMVFEKGKAAILANQGIVTAVRSDRIQTNIGEKSLPLGSPLFDLKGRIVGLAFIEDRKSVV